MLTSAVGSRVTTSAVGPAAVSVDRVNAQWDPLVAAPASCGEGGVDGDGSAEKDTAAAAAAGGDGSLHFVQFDAVSSSPSDHHYLDDTAQGIGGGKKWTKRVHKEWKILENNLPDTIYARVFEDRMDLLRAAMVGAAGTPYQDGLFFFDMQLPPSYPAVPPQVCYRSFGLRVNPNLDNSGWVRGARDGPLPAPGQVRAPGVRGVYLQGCPVGTLDADACATAESGERPCSAGLRLAVTGVVPRLIEAFSEIGADGCEQFDRLPLQLGCGGLPQGI
ncbi:putative ubiquitin-conjugating enzyme E2 38 [Dichanthelium oligosanthes]|uniref:Putative ubiquitin-conjugating enzyme E2 38 n=1 Tax=Dichanthelium oligosanthes TaxID=888268 RepID=A0A1E5W2Z9_9POAL|nr:putative ubiquitin-conjugating enzyme E2 38 [Dichanthelium oligosanthes]